MGHPPCDLPPGGRPLRTLQLGQILEDHRHAHLLPLIIADRGDGHEDRQRPFPQGDIDLLFDESLTALPHLPEDLFCENAVVGDEDLFIRPVQDLLGPDAEHLLRGPVDRGDDAVPVDGDHTGRDVAENGLHIVPSLFQIEVRLLPALLAPFEVFRHLVERGHEDPDLVVRDDVDLMVQIPLGDLPGRLGQILDRHGDSLGEIKAEPGRRKDDQEHHDEQRDDITEFDRRFQKRELPIFFGGLGDHVDLVHQTDRKVVTGRDKPDDFLRARERKDGCDPPDQIAASCLFDGGQLPAGIHILQPLGGKGLGEHLRIFPVADDHIVLLVLDMDLEHVELVGLVPPFNQGFQVKELFSLIKAVFRDIGTELAGVVLRLIGRLLIVNLRDLEGSVQGVPDADAEPVVDAVGEKIDRNKEQQDGRDERQADKGRDQTGPEFRTDDSVPPFIDQFDEIPDDQKDEQDDQDDVDVDEAENQRIAGDGEDDRLAAEDATFEIGHKGDEEHRHEDDDPLALPPFRLLDVQFDWSADLFHQ